MQRVVGHRFRQPGIADPVDPGKRIGYKIIPCEHPGIHTGDGARILLIFRNLHHGIAARDSTGIAAEILGDAGTDNAADIAAAGQGAFGKTGADGAAGEARDTAHIVTVFTGNGAEGSGIADQSQLHSAADTAHIAAFSGDFSRIFAVLHNGLQFVPPPLGQIPAGGVVLRVGGGFQTHDACNAARVEVRRRASAVGAAEHLAVGDHRQIHVGNIGDGFLRGILSCQGKGS